MPCNIPQILSWLRLHRFPLNSEHKQRYHNILQSDRIQGLNEGSSQAGVVPDFMFSVKQWSLPHLYGDVASFRRTEVSERWEARCHVASLPERVRRSTGKRWSWKNVPSPSLRTWVKTLGHIFSTSVTGSSQMVGRYHLPLRSYFMCSCFCMVRTLNNILVLSRAGPRS